MAVHTVQVSPPDPSQSNIPKREVEMTTLKAQMSHDGNLMPADTEFLATEREAFELKQSGLALPTAEHGKWKSEQEKAKKAKGKADAKAATATATETDSTKANAKSDAKADAKTDHKVEHVKK